MIIRLLFRTLVRRLSRPLAEDGHYNNDRQHGFRSGRSCLFYFLSHLQQIRHVLQMNTGLLLLLRQRPTGTFQGAPDPLNISLNIHLILCVLLWCGQREWSFIELHVNLFQKCLNHLMVNLSFESLHKNFSSSLTLVPSLRLGGIRGPLFIVIISIIAIASTAVLFASWFPLSWASNAIALLDWRSNWYWTMGL